MGETSNNSISVPTLGRLRQAAHRHAASAGAGEDFDGGIGLPRLLHDLAGLERTGRHALEFRG